LVCDFEPGSVTTADTGAGAYGAVHHVLVTAFILPARDDGAQLRGTMDVCADDSR
jgi:hypothetical protein